MNNGIINIRTAGQAKIEEEMAQAARGEAEAREQRETEQEAAHKRFFVDPALRAQAIRESQSGADGKMTEPNSQSEAEHRNALSAIATARLNEPDFVDAALRGPQAVSRLIEQHEEGTTAVGEGIDRELNPIERDRVETLRSRSDMRNVADPKNQVDTFAGTEAAAEREEKAHMKQLNKADKALTKELAKSAQ